MDTSIQKTSSLILTDYNMQSKPTVKSVESTIQPVDEVVKTDDRPFNEQEARAKLQAMNEQLKQHQLELAYERHEGRNQMVAKLIDSETKEIIKEIPPQKLLDYKAGMDELLGLLLDKKA